MTFLEKLEQEYIDLSARAESARLELEDCRVKYYRLRDTLATHKELMNQMRSLAKERIP